MALTELDIANAALARISERTISSMNENSSVARQVARLYGLARNHMFAAMDWRFATAQAVLTEMGSPQFPWSHQYALPADVARCRMVVPAQRNEGWNIGGEQMPFQEGIASTNAGPVRVINTDISPATLVYTIILPDPAMWDPGFVTAFTYHLAAELALPVTGSGPLAAAMRQQAQQAIASLMPVGQAQSVTQQARGPSTTNAARDT